MTEQEKQEKEREFRKAYEAGWAAGYQAALAKVRAEIGKTNDKVRRGG